MNATIDTRAEQHRIAVELAILLRELADACERAADGDEASRRLIDNHTDHYWFGLVVGSGKVQRLTTDD